MRKTKLVDYKPRIRQTKKRSVLARRRFRQINHRMDDMMKKVNVTRKQVIEVGQMVQRATIDMGADGNRQFIIGVYA